jgi:hypothetical protein
MAALNRIDARLNGQGQAIATLTEGFTTMQIKVSEKFAEMDKRAEEEKQALEQKLADFKKSLYPNSATPYSQKTGDTLAASGRASSAAGPSPNAPLAATRSTHRASSLPPPARPTRTSPAPTRTIIAFGFGRAVPRAALLAHYTEVLKQLPDHLAPDFDLTMFRGNGGKGYSIEISNVPAATAFVRFLTQNPIPWQGPRAGDAQIPIKFRLLPSPENAARGKMLAPIYAHLENHLPQATGFTTDMVIRANPKKGRIGVETAADMWVIASVGDDGNLVFHDEGIQALGLNRDELLKCA